jgi:2-polyprenyl-3-methyl-5-hydroxy-6-metoxy-1,4-benzoquinol methylase
MFYNLARKIRTDRVLEEMQYVCPDTRILDIGCGRDMYLFGQLDFHQNYYGFDNDAEERLPLMEDIFDIITMIAVFEHLDNPELVLQHCLRLLNSDGQIIITTPTRLGNILTPLVSWSDYKEHKRILNYKWLRNVIPQEYHIKHEIFECGLNQLYIIEREEKNGS